MNPYNKKHGKLNIIFLLAMTFIVVCIGLITFLYINGRDIKSVEHTVVLIHDKGDVMYKEDDVDDYIKLTSGEQEVKVGGYVRTGDESEAHILFEDNSLVSVGSNSELQIEQTENVNDKKLFLFLGKIWQRVQKVEEDGSFEVATPNALASVRGTIFMVNAIKDDSGILQSDVFVMEGGVDVSKIKKVENKITTASTQRVSPGEKSKVSGNDTRQEITVEEFDIEEESEKSSWFKKNRIIDEDYLKSKKEVEFRKSIQKVKMKVIEEKRNGEVKGLSTNENDGEDNLDDLEPTPTPVRRRPVINRPFIEDTVVNISDDEDSKDDHSNAKEKKEVDLSVDIDSSSKLTVGDEFDLNVTIKNGGPDKAKKVKLYVDINKNNLKNNNFEILSKHGSCNFEKNRLRCPLDDIEKNKKIKAVFKLKANALGLHNIKVKVESEMDNLKNKDNASDDKKVKITVNDLLYNWNSFVDLDLSNPSLICENYNVASKLGFTSDNIIQKLPNQSGNNYRSEYEAPVIVKIYNSCVDGVLNDDEVRSIVELKKEALINKYTYVDVSNYDYKCEVIGKQAVDDINSMFLAFEVKYKVSVELEEHDRSKMENLVNKCSSDQNQLNTNDLEELFFIDVDYFIGQSEYCESPNDENFGKLAVMIGILNDQYQIFDNSDDSTYKEFINERASGVCFQEPS